MKGEDKIEKQYLLITEGSRDGNRAECTKCGKPCRSCKVNLLPSYSGFTDRQKAEEYAAGHNSGISPESMEFYHVVAFDDIQKFLRNQGKGEHK